MGRVAVTGAAGFIGSHLVERLLERGDEVVGIDSFDPFYGRAAKERNLERARSSGSFTFSETDVRDAGALVPLLAGADAVVHLAARAGVRPSFGDPRLVTDINTGGTGSILSAAAEAGVPRFVFGSSSSVYGAGHDPPFREERPLGVAASPYAVSKRAAEELCRLLASRFARVVVLRFFTVYGPRQRPDLAIHRFTRLMREGRPLTVFGPGTSYRDYTYVDDVVDGIVASLSLESDFEVVNLGSGRPIRLGELVAALQEAVGTQAERRELPAQEGDLEGTWADIGKAKRLLGYEPRWEIDRGLREFVRWFDSAGAP